MKNKVVYGLFLLAEAVLYLLKTMIEAIANRYFAVSQMAIDTGYMYEGAIKTVNFTWAVCSLAVLAAAIAYHFIYRKENE